MKLLYESVSSLFIESSLLSFLFSIFFFSFCRISCFIFYEAAFSYIKSFILSPYSLVLLFLFLDWFLPSLLLLSAVYYYPSFLHTYFSFLLFSSLILHPFSPFFSPFSVVILKVDKRTVFAVWEAYVHTKVRTFALF